MPKTINKRNGVTAPWNKGKIEAAARAALASVASLDLVSERIDADAASRLMDKKAKFVADAVELRLDAIGCQAADQNTVENMVERALVDINEFEASKSYIIYRNTRKVLREQRSTMADIESIVGDYIQENDWRTAENANIGHSFSGLMLHLSGTMQAKYVLNKYDPAIAAAHRQGFMHIHDLSFGLAGYCAGWSLKDLLIDGFNLDKDSCASGPAKHFSSALGQMVNFLGTLQNEWAGAQAFNNVDTLLAPFIRVDAEEYYENLNLPEEAKKVYPKLDKKAVYKDIVKQAVQQFVFSMNTTSRWGGQSPFTNITLDVKCPKHMRNEAVVINGKAHDSWTYGDFEEEMEMINVAFLEVLLKGDYNGRIFTFPIPTYNVTEDFPWESRIGELLLAITAKYGIPYFQNFISSDLDPEDVRSMCCRLQMNIKELRTKTGGLFGAGDLTGSVGVVTLNLPKLAYIAANENEFMALVKHYATLAKQSLEFKRKMVAEKLEAGFFPYSKRYLKNGLQGHFSTIGLVGGHEACQNLLGKEHGIQTEEGVALMQRVIDNLRKLTSEFQEETGNLYNVEATPAEGTSYRLAKIDATAHPGIIQSGKGEPYYTNSTQLPVWESGDVLEALEHQNKLQPMYTGGTVFHTFLGEAVTDPKSLKEFILQAMTLTKLPYISITPTFSICKKHGYILGEHFDCPKCGEETEVYTRIVGYYRPVSRWNKGKKSEYSDRIVFNMPNGESTCAKKVDKPS